MAAGAHDGDAAAVAAVLDAASVGEGVAVGSTVHAGSEGAPKRLCELLLLRNQDVVRRGLVPEDHDPLNDETHRVSETPSTIRSRAYRPPYRPPAPVEHVAHAG